MESDDKVKDRLIKQTNDFCLTALDQTLGACSQKGSFARAAERVHDGAARACHAITEIGLCLPKAQRIPFDPWLEIAAMNPLCTSL